MAVEVQAVTAETFAAAVDLLARFFREEGFTTPPAKIAENLGRMLVDHSCWCALAIEHGAPLGVVTVSTTLYVEWGRLGEIGDLYVLAEHRKRGLARRLVEAAMAWCREQLCSAVSVTVTPIGESRHGLGEFYVRLGFAPSGRASMTALL
jgi:GNAT superfamily N-acetyltransferase